ncbi:MAG: sigma-E processing peptidase SpoIIGA [Defluviitaleaceae bacterium]|nr:sigma-E processing peptidase SpoIIGA [Defluviitaleaceae bacterium]
MIVEIYADVIFLINFLANGTILHIAGVLRRKRAKIWRTALAGAATSLLYTAALFTPMAGWLNIFTSFIIFAPGIFAAFKISGPRDFAFTLLAAYISAFALGGIAMAAMYIFGMGAAWSWSTYNFAMAHFTPQNLIVAVGTSFIVLKFVQHHIMRRALSKQAFCRFKIYLHDGVVELNALVDTGNSLIDPISHNPVIIAEFDKIKPLLPDSVVDLYRKGSQDDLAALAASFAAGDFTTRIRMIPYSAIGKSGVIAGFRPDRIEIAQKETRDVIIGICDFSLSRDGEYQALMNPLLCS